MQLIGPRDRSLIVRLQPGVDVHTHAGVLKHADLIGREWGSRILTHIGKTFYLLPPALDDLLRNIDRKTQIMYPKDIGYVLVTMGIQPGSQVVEAGTGSGAFTIALAYAVGPSGHVTTYEKRPEMMALAQENLAKVALSERVTFKLGDIGDGIAERGVNVLFLDLPNPEEYLAQLRPALAPGGFFGAILPTSNQVERLLRGLERHDFAFLEVSEILHRYYKPIAERLRPADRMTAHTGYLIFARAVQPAASDNAKASV